MCQLHKNITISGRVQGVGFRYTCKSFARSIGIKGIVKNMANGNVYIEAEGSDNQINIFIKWCHNGPSHATVRNVTVTNGEFKQYEHFEIVR